MDPLVVKKEEKPPAILLSCLAQVAMAFFLLLILDFFLLISVPKTVLQTPGLPSRLSFSFVGSEFFLLAILVLIVAYPVVVVSRIYSPNSRVMRRIAYLSLFVFIFTCLLVFIGSWALFLSTGSFLDPSSIAFLITNHIQLLQHIAHLEPYTLFAVPLVVAAISIFMMWYIPKISNISRKKTYYYNWLLLISLISIALCSGFVRTLSANSLKGVNLDYEAGTVLTIKDMIEEYRDHRSGPIIHFWAKIRNTHLSNRGIPSGTTESHVINRPIISMKQYLAGMDGRSVEKYNVIVVIIESLRTDQLKAGGSSVEVMPNLESVASQGMVFTRHYTQASHSNYADLCPLTSHYPLRSTRPYVYPENPTYPRVLIYDILKAIGYRTAVISSQNENWGKMINYLRTGGLDHFFHSESFDGPTYVPYNDNGFEVFVKGNKRSGKIDDRYTVAEAIRWIEEENNKPFFIYMNLQNSHVPYQTPSDFPRRFGPDHIDFTLRFNSFPLDKVDVVKQLYADSLAYVDYQLGKLFDYLKDTDQWSRTVLCVTGDTGQAFYEHGFAAHANMIFDEVMRVPLVICGPGIKKSEKHDRLAQHIDLPPTILDILGLPSHPSFQGVSLLDSAPDERAIYLVAQSPLAHQYGVIKGNYKLIYDVNRRISALLNLKSDPGETINIIKTHPDVARDLSQSLFAWRRLQINYYQNISQHMRFYPPVVDN